MVIKTHRYIVGRVKSFQTISNTNKFKYSIMSAPTKTISAKTDYGHKRISKTGHPTKTEY